MRKREPRGGLERKILTALLWVGVAPMVLALLIGYAYAHGAQRLAARQNLAMAAQKTAEGLNLTYRARLRTVGTLARDSAIISVLSSTERDPALAAQVEHRLRTEADRAIDGPAEVGLFDAEGRPVAGGYALPGGEPPARVFLPDLHAPAFVDFDLPRRMGYIAAPVRTPETDELLGYVLEGQGADSLLRFASIAGEETSGDDRYEVAYLTPQGFFIIRDDEDAPGERFRYDVGDRRLAERLRATSGNAGASLRLNDYKAGVGTVDVLLAYHPLLESGDMYVVVYRPVSAVYAKIKFGAGMALLGSAFLIALFCVVAYRHVHNNIARPVSLLNEGAQIIRQGDLDLKLKIETGDEIEELADSFNLMALTVKHNIGQLEESEERYRSLITSMRDGVCQADTNGIITYMNPAGLEILGYQGMEQAVGRKLGDLFVEEADRVRVNGPPGEASLFERRRTWLRRHDRRAICVDLAVNRVFDDDGEFIGEEGIFRDVTRSVQLEQKARDRSERIRVINQIANAINSSLEAGRLYESIAVELKKLIDFDFASVALLTESGEEVATRQLWPEPPASAGAARPCGVEGTCADCWEMRAVECLIVPDLDAPDAPPVGDFPPDVRSCLCVPLYASDRIIGTLKLGAHARSGFAERHMEVVVEMAPHVAVAIRNAQLVESLQASLEAVTRAREKLHEANEELKTLDETKTNLLSNVSHELRTPLVSVMGYTDMLLHERAGAINEAQREYLAISLRNVEKLVTLIENLLDFSRLHRGAEELVFETFDLVESARSSLQLVRPVADAREIALHIEVPDAPLLVEGDRSKLAQVFNNLLSNAVKFNHNGGSVTVTVRPSEGYAEVSVIDTGIGIPKEAQDKVFSRFYQVDDSSTRKYGGTGIGLAIAQDIVRLHGGRITVTGDVGQGSRFDFSLPMTARRRADEEAEPAMAAPETHLLVELITQDRPLRIQVGNLLEAEGMDLIHAAQVSTGISLVLKYSPDCVLVDVPEGEAGATALEDIFSSTAAVGKTPIIVLTSDDALFEPYRVRAAARVKRGFRKSGLLSAIHYALGRGIDEGVALGPKVLCVDDDTEVLIFMARCLESEGYVVDCSPSGDDALEAVRTRDYGLVLLDIAMPGIDGWETCRRMKSDASLNGLKVCLVTAKPIDSSLARIKDCGADGYLLKPFKPEELVGLVQGLGASATAREN